jgi:hypothetical protein
MLTKVKYHLHKNGIQEKMLNVTHCTRIHRWPDHPSHSRHLYIDSRKKMAFGPTFMPDAYAILVVALGRQRQEERSPHHGSSPHSCPRLPHFPIFAATVPRLDPELNSEFPPLCTSHNQQHVQERLVITRGSCVVLVKVP